MEDSPNPNRITNASWRYINARLAMDPGDAVYAGSYVNKPGYHVLTLEWAQLSSNANATTLRADSRLIAERAA